MHLHSHFQTIHSTLLQTFQWNNWFWTLNRKYVTHQCTKISQKETSCFLIAKFLKSSEFYYLQPGLYLSIGNIVETMKSLIQEIHNQNESFITVKVSRGTQKVDTYLANEASGLKFFSKDPGHSFGSIFGNEVGVMLKGKGS